VGKVEISQHDTENRPEFLLRDKKACENYEIIDAIIPLTHSITLEKFNFGIKSL
jgi:hypothetical protein